VDPKLNPEAIRARRLTGMAVFGFLWAAVIVARLFYLQGPKHEELLKHADKRQHLSLEIKAPRGTIVDRAGEKLVVSVPAESLAINPRLLKDPAIAVEILSSILKIDARKLLERIQVAQGLDPEGRKPRNPKMNLAFLWVKRKITPEESARLKAYKFDWMEFRQESQRVYLHGRLGANLLGSVDHEEKGNAGVEESLDEDLQGRPGQVRVLTDSRRRGIESRIEVPAQPGKTVALTIDIRLQYYCDQILRDAALREGAVRGSAVVMDPRNGEVLCMSSYPSFDSNESSASVDFANWNNRAVTEPFEPGSVMKVFSIAAGLESKAVVPTDSIFCHNGRMPWFGSHLTEHPAYGWLPVEGVLWHSSNLGTAEIARRTGSRNLYRVLHNSFGFGAPTGIGLPAESKGSLAPPDKWGQGEFAFVSYGYRMSATTLQLARALSVIANGGLMVQPRLVLWKQSDDGNRETLPHKAPQRVLRPETAIQTQLMMEGVILKGTGKLARLVSHTAGGKTGTAKIWDPNAKVYTSFYNGSFVGFAPLSDPRVVVAVSLSQVKKAASQVAAPAFRDIASAALRLKGIPGDLPEQLPQETPPLVAAVIDPEPGQPALEETAVQAATETELVVAPRVPDFRGKSIREVMVKSVETGVEVVLEGSGVARWQDPPAGGLLAAGRRVKVHFAR